MIVALSTEGEPLTQAQADILEARADLAANLD